MYVMAVCLLNFEVMLIQHKGQLYGTTILYEADSSLEIIWF